MPNSAAPTGLEAELAAILQEFAGRLVDAIRNASIADVAALTQSPPLSLRAIAGGDGRERFSSARRTAARASKETTRDARTSVRQTASRRAELGDLVVRTLEGAGRPLGVRALSTELGIAADRLGAPLRELRSAGRIKKHGEKRATTYSAA